MYHHSDGYPEGVGADLKRWLRDRMNDSTKDNRPTYIALDMIRHGIPSGDRMDMTYEPTAEFHWDAEYAYVIDCDEKTLKCYPLHGYFEERLKQWERIDEQTPIEIPDPKLESPLYYNPVHPVMLTNQEARLVATTLHTLGKTFRRDPGQERGAAAVTNVLTEDVAKMLELASSLNATFGWTLF